MAYIAPALRKAVEDVVGTEIKGTTLIAKDEFTATHEVALGESRTIWLRTPTTNHKFAIIEAEVATIKYLAERTAIPVPRVIALHRPAHHEFAGFALLEKPRGTCLDSIFENLSPADQNSIVASLAQWMTSLFHHRFAAIGSLTLDQSGAYAPGPSTSPPFYADGRCALALDRGPWPSARAYYRACAQRELDASRALFAQDAPEAYQRNVEEAQLGVERIAGLFCDLTARCPGLDDDDPALAPFSLDVHGLSLKHIYVSAENPTEILSVADWQFIGTRPLWACARLPAWLCPSLAAGNNERSMRLSAVFRAEVARADGPDSAFLRALRIDDARETLDELSSYDAVRDGFLLLPALENVLATLPGHEDFAGLNALLDPSTLPGRAARINLVTRGSNAMFLAMTPPRSPGRPEERRLESAIPTERPVLVT